MNAWTVIGVSTGILSLLLSGLGLFVRLTVKTAIQEANAEQLVKINGTYVRSAGSTITGAEIERTLHALRAL